MTTVPREKYPLGQTVTKVNEQRERTRLFTRRYLEEQLLTVLAGARAPAPCSPGAHGLNASQHSTQLSDCELGVRVGGKGPGLWAGCKYIRDRVSGLGSPMCACTAGRTA